MKAFLLLLLFSSASSAQIQTPATLVSWRNGQGTEFRDFDDVPLSEGERGPFSGPGDGDLLQLGYFDLGTVANPFLGSWIVLTSATIGDKGDRGDGRFALSIGFTTNFPQGVALPSEGTPLAIRFFDRPARRAPQFFNTISNQQGDWNWKAPAVPNPFIGITLNDPNYPGLVWQDGATTAFRTTGASGWRRELPVCRQRQSRHHHDGIHAGTVRAWPTIAHLEGQG